MTWFMHRIWLSTTSELVVHIYPFPSYYPSSPFENQKIFIAHLSIALVHPTAASIIICKNDFIQGRKEGRSVMIVISFMVNFR
jgi:hypothetical protein